MWLYPFMEFEVILTPKHTNTLWGNTYPRHAHPSIEQNCCKLYNSSPKMILLRLEPPWFDLIPLIGLKILAIPFENQLTAGEVWLYPFMAFDITLTSRKPSSQFIMRHTTHPKVPFLSNHFHRSRIVAIPSNPSSNMMFLWLKPMT